jgi:hypothetical protein
MTKDRIADHDQIKIEDDCIDGADHALNLFGRYLRHNRCTTARPRWCSTSTGAVLGVLSSAFVNRTPGPPRTGEFAGVVAVTPDALNILCHRFAPLDEQLNVGKE